MRRCSVTSFDTVVPERLYLFKMGVATIPTPAQPLLLSLGCYLIQMSDDRHILIDSGMPAGYTPKNIPPTAESRSVLDCLAEIGLQPDDIDMVISTHFDVDHVGFHDSFLRAEHVVQREHYEWVIGGNEAARYADANPHWNHPAIQYRLVDGDVDLLPGVRLIKTNGHTPGHQSVLVRLPQTGLVLLVVDAAMFGRLFTPERKAGPGDQDEAALIASTRKLIDLVEREKVALTIFGHDGAQWAELKLSPDYYG